MKVDCNLVQLYNCAFFMQKETVEYEKLSKEQQEHNEFIWFVGRSVGWTV